MTAGRKHFSLPAGKVRLGLSVSSGRRAGEPSGGDAHYLASFRSQSGALSGRLNVSVS